MSIKTTISIFARGEDGAFTTDWALQVAFVAIVSISVLSSVSSGDRVSATGDTHYNGFTITSQYP